MRALALYEKLSRRPFGKQLFSTLFCLKAPYFRTIRPHFSELSAGRCVVHLRNRRSVRNHIGTVHAIAMCNLAEAAAGLCIEASLPKNLRWIPKGMQVDYLKKATTDLKAVCAVDPARITIGENVVNVEVTNAQDEQVLHAKITMHVSEKPQQ